MERMGYQSGVLAEQCKNWWSLLQTVTLMDSGESGTVDMSGGDCHSCCSGRQRSYQMMRMPLVVLGEDIQAVRPMKLKRVKRQRGIRAEVASK